MSSNALWHVNSTWRGGGIAEILDALSAHSASGLSHRRYVMDGDPGVFRTTKRLHHRLHGQDRGPLPDARERQEFEEFGKANAERFLRMHGPIDLALLHDPHTLTMAPHLVAAGVCVAWRCHIGTAEPNDTCDSTWDYLSNYWEGIAELIFSDRSLVPAQAIGLGVRIIPPSIDLGSEKNRAMGTEEQKTVLRRAGMEIQAADVVIAQISRWDPLKDMEGVLAAFRDTPELHRARLVLLGPAPSGIVDDPEAQDVLDRVQEQWRHLPLALQDRVHIVCSALEDERGNARLVNAIQRRADVVVQKSLQEGFGLTVTEAMAKGKAIVASRIGGIATQLQDGVNALLLGDPGDRGQFAKLVLRLIEDEPLASRLGAAAADRARREYATERELRDHADLVDVLSRR